MKLKVHQTNDKKHVKKHRFQHSPRSKRFVFTPALRFGPAKFALLGDP